MPGACPSSCPAGRRYVPCGKRSQPRDLRSPWRTRPGIGRTSAPSGSADAQAGVLSSTDKGRGRTERRLWARSLTRPHLGPKSDQSSGGSSGMRAAGVRRASRPSLRGFSQSATGRGRSIPPAAARTAVLTFHQPWLSNVRASTARCSVQSGNPSSSCKAQFEGGCFCSPDKTANSAIARTSSILTSRDATRASSATRCRSRHVRAPT